MAKANWQQASQLQDQIPHTYTAMEHLIMAMADAYNNRGKSSLFGHDKGLKSYMKFEEKLKGTLLAMSLDGLVDRHAKSSEYLEKLILVISAWFEIFPNWPDAGAFAHEKFQVDEPSAKKLICGLIGLSK